MKLFVAFLWVALFIAPVVLAVVQDPSFILALLGLAAVIGGGLWLIERVTGLRW